MKSKRSRYITKRQKTAGIKRALEKGLCRWCGLDVKRFSPYRRTFCSDDCVHEYKLRSNSSYVRKYIAKRDKYVCQICGLKCYGFIKKLRKYVDERLPKYTSKDDTLKKKLEIEFFEHLGLEWVNTNGRSTFYDIDHILPSIFGGAQCGEDNLRTLCLSCHRKETKELRKKLSNIKKRGKK